MKDQHPFCFHKWRGKEARSVVQLCYNRSHHYAFATFNGLRLDASLSPVRKMKCPEILYSISVFPIIPIVFCVTYETDTSKISSQKFLSVFLFQTNLKIYKTASLKIAFHYLVLIHGCFHYVTRILVSIISHNDPVTFLVTILFSSLPESKFTETVKHNPEYLIKI